MLIGVPREIKNHEYRVGITPAGVRALTDAGHEVRVETRAGERIGFDDELYLAAGAKIVPSAAEVYACPLIVKVKEPQESEIPLLKEGQVLFTYLHLAADPELTRRLIERKIVGIAYETVTDDSGALPLLTPMSEVAGRIAIQAGATALQLANGGRGVLLDGLRVEYADGFGLMRPSNTTPVIVLRFEADNEAALRRIQEEFRAVLLAAAPNVALPF